MSSKYDNEKNWFFPEGIVESAYFSDPENDEPVHLTAYFPGWRDPGLEQDGDNEKAKGKEI